jgi:type IV pilus assembly protein PilA
MRKKIEELRNREEGFTLVELLAVIVILGIIVAIAIPAIGNITNRARTDATEADQQLVLDAARLYDIDNPNGFPVTVTELEEAGYLDTRQGDDDRPNYTVEKVTSNDGVVTFEID